MANGDVLFPQLDPGFEPTGPAPVVGIPTGSFPGGVGTDPGFGGPIGGPIPPGRPVVIVPPEMQPTVQESPQGFYFLNPPAGGLTTARQRDAFLETPEGRAWFDTYSEYSGNYRVQNPLIFDSPGLSIHEDVRGYYGDRLTHYLSQEEQPVAFLPGGPNTNIDISLGDLIGGIFAPDTPGPQVGQEREDQWWDAPLDWIGDLATDAALAWARRGIDWIEGEIFPPGHAPGRTQPGGPGGIIRERPGLAPGNQFTRPDDPWVAPVDPNLYPPATRPALGGERTMPSVPTSMPGGAPLLGTGSSTSGSPWCITPGGASITQRPAMGMRLPSRVDVPTVDRSGNVRFTTFKNMGRPLLWSGDLAASKRVRKVAAKARRAKGR